MCICTYIHAYIHSSWILDLLCWILFVFFHWISECSVSVACVAQAKKPCCGSWHLLNGVLAAMTRMLAWQNKIKALIEAKADATPAGAGIGDAETLIEEKADAAPAGAGIGDAEALIEEKADAAGADDDTDSDTIPYDDTDQVDDTAQVADSSTNTKKENERKKRRCCS